MYFVKSRRAQSIDDYETWHEGGVATTLNLGDNTGDTRATVLIIYKDPIGTLQARDFKGINHEGARDGKLVVTEELIVFYGNRVDDIRIQGDVINTLQARMGTGGGNMPIVSFDTQFGSNANTFENQSPTLKASQQPPSVVSPTLSASNNPSRSPQSSEITAQVDAVLKASSTVRRLTPTECERLQGFPDGWTDGQADSHRYKQMGNAVAVPVVSWLIQRLMEASNDMD